MPKICCQSIWNSSNTKEKLWDSWVLSASVWVARSPVDFCYATTEAERRPLVVSVPILLRTQQTRVPTRRKAFLRNYGKQKKCQRTLDTNGDTNDFKRVLVFSSTLVYNLLRKWIGYDSDLPSVLKCYKNSILNFGRCGMLFLFIIMIVYVWQSRKNN